MKVNWEGVSEYHASLMHVGTVITMLKDDIMDVYMIDSNVTECVNQFTRFETELQTKKQYLINSLVIIAFEYACTILDHCINTQLYTLSEEEVFPAERTQQTISRGYDRLDAFYKDMVTAINDAFTRGLFTKFFSKLDVEVKERVTRIHYTQVFLHVGIKSRREELSLKTPSKG